MKLSLWGPHHSAISAIGLEGLLCVDILEDGETVNAVRFNTFLNDHLVPVLNPFNGVNSRSVVVLGMFLLIDCYSLNWSEFLFFSEFE